MIIYFYIKDCDMPRNLDLTALRSFVAVADAGGVTRAAGFLNLTQSAVSMQLKRLEESLGLELLDRRHRQTILSATGEQLLSYARRMVALNDEVVARLTDPSHEGEIVVGVPHDIVYPVIPRVLRQFHTEFPRMRVNLLSSNTIALKALFAKGEVPLILTTEDDRDAGGETVNQADLIWVGAPDGRAWRDRPLRLAFERNCIFRSGVQKALDASGIDWEMAVDSESTRTVEACVSADLAVHASMEGHCPPELAPIDHGGALPPLPGKQINLYVAESIQSAAFEKIVALIRQGYVAASGRDHHLAGHSAAA
jgi:DNA-binding transcriptional LysR family regulator